MLQFNIKLGDWASDNNYEELILSGAHCVGNRSFMVVSPRFYGTAYQCLQGHLRPLTLLSVLWKQFLFREACAV